MQIAVFLKWLALALRFIVQIILLPLLLMGNYVSKWYYWCCHLDMNFLFSHNSLPFL